MFYYCVDFFYNTRIAFVYYSRTLYGMYIERDYNDWPVDM